MFSQHQPIIGKWARARPENFAHVQLLAILSARQPFERVGEDMAAVLEGDHKPLFDWKLNAWLDARDYSGERLARCEMIYLRGDGPRMEAELLAEITSWLGFGFIKGGFVAQLAYGVIGCIDSRNQTAYNLPQFAAVKTTALHATRLKHARRYVRLCRRLGGCEALWNAWCDGYATSRVAARLLDGWECSAEHCRILGLDPGPNYLDDMPF